MRTVGVRLMADIADYQAKFRQAGATAKTLGGELDRASKAGKLDHATQQATGLGVGLLGAAAVAVKFSMDFDKQMSSVQAATHATSGEMGQLRQAAMDAGADTKFSATEAAKGIEELAKAGVSTKDVLGGGLKGALDLAAAGELDVGEAAETAASAMTQFKLNGKDVPHIADLLAAAAGKAQGSVHDMGMALNQSGLVASQMGVSIEETTGTLAAFASAGLIGSDAGTSLKTALLMLANPTSKASDLMQELGIHAYDAGGKFVGMAGLADQLKSRLSGLTQEQRNSALATIFGSDAIRAASVLYEQGGAGINDWTNKVNDTGFAAEAAAIKTDNLAGDVERLKGSFETLAIQAGSGANGGLRTITKALDAMVNQFGKLPPGVSSTIVALGGLSGVLILAGVGWMKARAAIAATVLELNAAGPAGARAAVGLQAATKWAGRAAIAFVGLQVAGAVFDKFGNAAVNVDKLTGALEDYASTGKMTQGITDEFGKNLDDLALIASSADAATHGFWGALNDLGSAIPGVSSIIDSLNESIHGTSFNDATERMKGLDEAFSSFIATQKDAQKAGELWNQILLKSGLNTDQLAALLPNAWKGLQELQKSAHDGASAQDDLAGKTTDSAKAMKEQKEQAKELKKAFDDLFDQYLSADQAAVEYEKTLKSTNKELKSGAKTLDLHKKAGQENRTAVLDLIKAIKDQREANINNGMSVTEADRRYRSQIETLKSTMRHLGFTKDDVKKLIDKYRDLPRKVGTTIEAPGLSKTDKAIKEYDKKIDGLARKVNTTVSVSGKAKAEKELAALLIQRDAAAKGISVAEARRIYNKQNINAATGGHIRGPGTDTSDSIDARLSDYEYVVKAKSVRKLGVRALDHINEYGELPPQYAGGGLVNMRFPVDITGMKMPSLAQVLAGVIPSGGRTSDFIVRVVRAAFPGMAILSKDRPGARTLSGNVSYHSLGRAVDFSPSRPLAEWWNLHYKSRTKEFISPWNDLNIWNGQRHTYTGAIYRQHNFAGGNAHDHIAMANGGVVREPVVGVGASGRTYSFGEYGPETVTPGVITRGAAAGRGGGGITIVIQGTHNGPIGSRIELDNWYVGMADRLKSRLR